MNSFFSLELNECYISIYDHLNITLLSNIIQRDIESIEYKNIVMRNCVRIFCDNYDNTSVATLYDAPSLSVYGIIVKITKDELNILKSYYKNYYLQKVTSFLTSHMYEYIEQNGIKYLEHSSTSVKSCMFIHKNRQNLNKIRPSKTYIESIRNMLNDRIKIEPYINQKPITIYYLKNNKLNNMGYENFVK
jgi:hypothetical protein